MQLPAILEGPSLTRLLQGAAVGCLATVIIGFNWGGWMLGSTAKEMAVKDTDIALVAVLGPMCADKFRHGPDAGEKMTELKQVRSWMQDSFIQDGGWATFAGITTPGHGIAQECAKLLTAM
jgi:hypothetical protein